MTRIFRWLSLSIIPVILAASPPALAQHALSGAPPFRYHSLTADAQGHIHDDKLVTVGEFQQLRAHSERLASGAHPELLAPDINRVSDTACRDRSDFWKLWNNTTIAGGVCFANNGTVRINVYNVYQIDTGNNTGNFAAGSVHFPGSGRQYCAWDSLVFHDDAGNPVALADVTLVSIVGRTSYPCD
jgi:Beta/Gamma crystallin